MDVDISFLLEKQHLQSMQEIEILMSDSSSDAPSQVCSDAGFSEEQSSSTSTFHPVWNSQLPSSSDEGFMESPSSDTARDQAEIVNHQISNVPRELHVAGTNAFIGTALFTKRCRLSDDDGSHQRRIVLTPNDCKQIDEFTLVGPNLVEDDMGERFQLIILSAVEQMIYQTLQKRFQWALGAGMKNARALSECIFHPGSKLIQFKEYTIFVQLEHWGNLHNHLIRHGEISEEQCRFLFRQMLEIVEFMHKIGALLRDISLRRWIFLDEAKTKLVLGTFVDMVLLDDIDNDLLSERFGCPANMAPEMVTCGIDQWSGRAADVWSLGVCLYVMATRRFPFYDGTAQKLFRKIRHVDYSIPEGHYPALSFRVKELIRDILVKKPDARLTVRQILQRSWFR